jgi:hypothetical protein
VAVVDAAAVIWYNNSIDIFDFARWLGIGESSADSVQCTGILLGCVNSCMAVGTIRYVRVPFPSK